MNGVVNSLVQLSRRLSSHLTKELSFEIVFRLTVLFQLFCAKNSFTISLDSSSLRSIRARCANKTTSLRGFSSRPFSLLNLFAIDLTSFLASITDNRRRRVALSAVSHLRGSFFSRTDSSAVVKIKKGKRSTI